MKFDRKCICDRKECRKYQIYFTRRRDVGYDEPRGGECMRVNLSGNKPHEIKKREEALPCLGVSREEMDDPPSKSFKEVNIARHHWSVAQNRHFMSRKRKKTHPVTIEKMKELGDPFDENDYVKISGKKLYLLTPSYPLANVKFEFEADPVNAASLLIQMQQPLNTFQEADLPLLPRQKTQQSAVAHVNQDDKKEPQPSRKAEPDTASTPSNRSSNQSTQAMNPDPIPYSEIIRAGDQELLNAQGPVTRGLSSIDEIDASLVRRAAQDDQSNSSMSLATTKSKLSNGTFSGKVWNGISSVDRSRATTFSGPSQEKPQNSNNMSLVSSRAEASNGTFSDAVFQNVASAEVSQVTGESEMSKKHQSNPGVSLTKTGSFSDLDMSNLSRMIKELQAKEDNQETPKLGNELMEARTSGHCTPEVILFDRIEFTNQKFSSVGSFSAASQRRKLFVMTKLFSMTKTSRYHVPVDFVKAAQWYQKAADQGDWKAMLQLAYMYENGAGVPKDTAMAAEWLRKSREFYC